MRSLNPIAKGDTVLLPDQANQEDKPDRFFKNRENGMKKVTMDEGSYELHWAVACWALFLAFIVGYAANGLVGFWGDLSNDFYDEQQPMQDVTIVDVHRDSKESSWYPQTTVEFPDGTRVQRKGVSWGKVGDKFKARKVYRYGKLDGWK